MEIALLVITDGRGSELSRTIDSQSKYLQYEFSDRVIVNDSQDASYEEFLESNYSDSWTILHNRPKGGFSGAINRGWQHLKDRSDYIFHLEGDFVFTQNESIEDLIFLLHTSKAIQMMFKRDAVLSNPVEAEFGGYIEANPDRYIQHDGYMLHDNFFSTNPSIYSTQLCHYGWPEGQGEIEFFDRVRQFHPEAMCGIVGNKYDAPRVHHIGYHRIEDWKI